MEQWQDQGIVISVRRHGENGAIVGLLTQDQGRHVGYVRGVNGKTMRGALEAGNLVDAKWQSRLSDSLGSYALELASNPGVHFMQDPLRLAALQSVCALCDEALPEREPHQGVFRGALALFEAMKNDDIWSAAYVMWEIAFLKELGFSLDLSQCASGNGDSDLAYVSPKTGRAVSTAAGEPYKDKLLALPAFLTPSGGEIDAESVLEALQITEYFLQNWAFAHHSRGIPEARLRFSQRFAKTIRPPSEKTGSDTNE